MELYILSYKFFFIYPYHRPWKEKKFLYTHIIYRPWKEKKRRELLPKKKKMEKYSVRLAGVPNRALPLDLRFPHRNPVSADWTPGEMSFRRYMHDETEEMAFQRKPEDWSKPTLRRQWAQTLWQRTRTLRPWTLTLRPMSKTLRSYSKTSRLQTDTLLATYSNRHYGHSNLAATYKPCGFVLQPLRVSIKCNHSLRPCGHTLQRYGYKLT